MNKFRQLMGTGLAALSLSLLSTMAVANSHSYNAAASQQSIADANPYISGFVGAARPLNEDYTDADGSDANHYDLRSKWGFTGGGAFGYRYRNFRVELGLDYAISKADVYSASLDEEDEGEGPKAGKQKATALMLNGLYDCYNESTLTPFVGVGLGLVHLRHDFSYVGTQSDQILVLKSNDSVFGYQGILGVGWEAADNLRVTLDYRFLATVKSDFNMNGIQDGGEGDDITRTADVRGRYMSHRINLGVTYFM